jgi:hypothetical protein
MDVGRVVGPMTRPRRTAPDERRRRPLGRRRAGRLGPEHSTDLEQPHVPQSAPAVGVERADEARNERPSQAGQRLCDRVREAHGGLRTRDERVILALADHRVARGLVEPDRCEDPPRSRFDVLGGGRGNARRQTVERGRNRVVADVTADLLDQVRLAGQVDAPGRNRDRDALTRAGPRSQIDSRERGLHVGR